MFTTGPAFWRQINSGGVSVNIPAGALVLTGYAPTVTAAGSASISVPAGALTLTGYAPVVTTTPPIYCVYETFPDLTAYYLERGSAASFSVTSGAYGNQLTVASTTDAFASQIVRDITERTVRTAHFRVRVTNANIDDAAFITFGSLSAGDYLTFTPRRETSYRAVFTIQGPSGSQSIDFGATALTVNEYYDFDIAMSASTLTYSLTKVSDSSIFGSGVVGNTAGDIRIAAIAFFNDATGPTTTAEYLNIAICGEF